jgi:hypothetical protein
MAAWSCTTEEQTKTIEAARRATGSHREPLE